MVVVEGGLRDPGRPPPPLRGRDGGGVEEEGGASDLLSGHTIEDVDQMPAHICTEHTHACAHTHTHIHAAVTQRAFLPFSISQ